MKPTYEQDFRRHRARIKKFTEKWAMHIGANIFKRDNYFSRDQGDFSGPDVLAISKCDWRYLTSSITWNMTRIVALDPTDRDLENYVIHELLHPMVHEMREEGIDHEERVVTQLQWAIRWTYEAGIKEGLRQSK